ncbi:MAG: hypothetical protein U1E16_01445 [Hyphomicrobiales bacterium]
MRYRLEKDMTPVDPARAACRKVGSSRSIPIRGGTDGSRLTEQGVPTPNIFTGMAMIHGLLEWVSLQDMAAAVQVCLNLAQMEVPGNGKHHLLACSVAFILAPWLSQASACGRPDRLRLRRPHRGTADRVRCLRPAADLRHAFGRGVINFYGQLNPAYQGFNDGEETTSNLVDNGNWNPRVGFTIVEPADGITLRASPSKPASACAAAPSSRRITRRTPSTGSRASLRWFEVAGEGSLGTVSLGQGSMASDGTAGLDDSATFVAGATDSSDGFGSLPLPRQRRQADQCHGRAGQQYLNGALALPRPLRHAGGGRRDAVHLAGQERPRRGGQHHLLRCRHPLDGTVGDFAIRAAAGYQWLDNPDTPDTRRLAGSMTVVHEPTGLNSLGVSAGEQVGGASYVRGGGWAGATRCSTPWPGWRFRWTTIMARTSRRKVLAPKNYGIYAVRLSMPSVDLYGGVRKFTHSAKLPAPITRTLMVS